MAVWRAARERFPVVAFSIALLAAWEAAVRLLDVPKYLLPAPSGILNALIASMATLVAVHTPVTLAEAGVGLLMALAAGVVTGGAVHAFPLARRTVYPLLVVSQTVPVMVLAPLLVIWFGYGALPKLLLVAIACYFPIAVAVVDGLDSADAGMLKLLRSMGARPWQQFIMVKVPAALSSLFTGLRVAASYAVMAAVVAEWMGAEAGLGTFIVRSAHSFRTEHVFAGIVLVSLYSVGLFVVVDAVRRRALPWEIYLREDTWHRQDSQHRAPVEYPSQGGSWE
ncbi:MAG: ABC transporter permease [Firmicutes bacterium]|nr:ABC transporter permease [Bacillota bacterium]